MSRRKLFKKERRKIKTTIFLYCEGLDDKIFLEYLKEVFARNSNFCITIKQNYGGQANSVLVGALKKQGFGDRVVCFYDTDTGFDKELKQKVESCGILCVENKPCLEAFLLGILEEKDYSCYQKCDSCKKIFETKYLDKKKRRYKVNYGSILPKKLLIKKSKENKNLKTLIDIISGNL